MMYPRLFSLRALSFAFFMFVLSSFEACSQTTIDSLFFHTDNDTDDKPLSIISDSIPQIEKDTLRVIQWNIGHFSMGKSSYSRVTDKVFFQRVQSFEELLNSNDADIAAISEYSVYFTNTKQHPQCLADTLLFKNYPYYYCGNNGRIRGYSLNAVFAKNELFDFHTVDFESNKTATITHTTKIKATDYYYVESYFIWNNHIITLICTHLAFDNNNDSVVINQMKELIKVTQDDDHVIICGDFNSSNNYSIFTENGFTVANNGEWGTYPSTNPSQPLDNIIVKGISIKKASAIPSFLSDHLPLICELTLE